MPATMIIFIWSSIDQILWSPDLEVTNSILMNLSLFFFSEKKALAQVASTDSATRDLRMVPFPQNITSGDTKFTGLAINGDEVTITDSR